MNRTCGSEDLNRRSFLRTSGLAFGAAGLAAFSRAESIRAGEASPGTSHQLLSRGDVILFQGDSITDAGRSREQAGEINDQRALGSGYAWLAAVELLVDRPKAELKIYNRGISGNKVFQLADRWQSD